MFKHQLKPCRPMHVLLHVQGKCLLHCKGNLVPSLPAKEPDEI